MSASKSDTRQRILDAAVDLFSRKGYAAVSVREIARAVGIKESSMYNHFRSKAEVMESVLDFYQAEMAKSRPPEETIVDKLAAVSAEPFLRIGFERTMSIMADPTMGKITRIILMEQFRDERARKMVLNTITQSLPFLEKIFASMIQMGLIKPLDPKVLAVEYQYPLNTMFLEYTILKYDGLSTSEVEKRMSDHISFFVARVSAKAQG